MRVHSDYGDAGVYWTNVEEENCSILIDGLTQATCTERTLRNLHMCLTELFWLLSGMRDNNDDLPR